MRASYHTTRGRVLAVLLAILVVSAAFTMASAPPARTAVDIALLGTFNAASSFYQAGIAASDINGDGRKELLVGNTNGYLYCLNDHAALLWKYKTSGSIQGTPACYDVDGDGRKEVWVGDLAGRMWGFDSSGKVLTKWGWPRKVRETGGLDGIFSSPAVGDITGDGLVEIVVGTWGQYVYAWTYTGQMAPGWPYNNEDTIWSSPALADLDYDGVKEVIIGADSTGGVNWPYPPGGLLYAFEGDATIMDGFPRVTPEVTWSSPAVADIDGDGRYEIIVGTGHYYKDTGRITTEGHRVYAYNHDGTKVQNWPVKLAGSTFASPAIGDVDGDGVREVVICTNKAKGTGQDGITAIKPYGRKVFEVAGPGGPMMGSPALGDINADGRAEAIVGSGQHVCAWDGAGNLIWSANLGNYVVSNPVVGDFDRDNRVEMAVATGDAPGGTIPGGSVFVFDCGPVAGTAPGGNSAFFPWPAFRLNEPHTATILTGREPEPPAPAPKKKWYLAEGSTGPGMETWVLVQNPNNAKARVTVNYMTPGGPVEGPVANLPPNSRRTFNVADTVPNAWEVSSEVAADRPVIAERAMYGDGRSWGHESIGADTLKKKWYLAEGSTGGGMETWVLVANPGETTASVTLQYMTDIGPVDGPTAKLPPNSRNTFNVADTVSDRWQVSTVVTSDAPVVAERAMYGPGRQWAHDSVGVTTPAVDWYLAEGSTGGGMEDWVLVQNPIYPEAVVTVTYMTPKGPKAGPTVRMPSESRMTLNVADTVPNAWEVSAKISADKPVIAERAMYGPGRVWGHESIGSDWPEKTWYLAEGSTGQDMETWVLVANPGTSTASVSLTYMTPSGPVTGPTVRLAGGARTTFNVAATVPNTWEVSTKVTSDRPVVVERAMYGAGRSWGHDSIGYGQ